LRTFSEVLPGKMASFMNALTWQAAWLRHFHQWDRVAVGYALTDVPERVLEVYGIPGADLEEANKVLVQLHAQREFEALRACCVNPREDDEELLPAMPFNTFLNGFVETRKQERALAASKKSAERELVVNQEELKALPATQIRLELQRDKLRGRITEIETATRGLRAASGQAVQAADVGSRAAQAAELERERAEVNTRLIAVVDQIQALPRRKLALEARQPLLQTAVDGLAAQVRDERDPVKRELKFGKFRIPSYFLNVAITVKPGMLEPFVTGMGRLADSFKWEFIAAGKNPPPGNIRTEDAEAKVMHLWKFGDADNLYQQMVELRENQQFAEVEQFTSKVLHMLMCDWEALSETKRPPPFRE
jgi:hypothetical protein